MNDEEIENGFENPPKLDVEFLAYIKSSSMDDEGEKRLTIVVSSSYLNEIQKLERFTREILRFNVQKET